MAAADEDALRCDFAQFYHVLDYRRLPLRAAAVFACGLPEDSRIMRKMAGAELPAEIFLLATIADRLGAISWQIAGDKQAERPQSILQTILGGDQEAPRRFTSGADFSAAWAAIHRGD